jgi:hypothetical protein
LRCAPFVFLHAIILATDAILAISNHQLPEKELAEDTQLRILDQALLEMGLTWKIAKDARERLQSLAIQQPRPSSTMTSAHYSSSVAAGTWGQDIYAPDSGMNECDWQNFVLDTEHTFGFGPNDMVSPYLWNLNLLDADLSKLQGDGFVGSDFEARLGLNSEV